MEVQRPAGIAVDTVSDVLPAGGRGDRGGDTPPSSPASRSARHAHHHPKTSTEDVVRTVAKGIAPNALNNLRSLRLTPRTSGTITSVSEFLSKPSSVTTVHGPRPTWRHPVESDRDGGEETAWATRSRSAGLSKRSAARWARSAPRSRRYRTRRPDTAALLSPTRPGQRSVRRGRGAGPVTRQCGRRSSRRRPAEGGSGITV
jgi:hypothetical protein